MAEITNKEFIILTKSKDLIFYIDGVSIDIQTRKFERSGIISNQKKEEVSMAKEYVKHDEEFKKMIVNLCETSKDKTMSDIAREYGITRASITQWRKKYGTIITSTGEVTNNDEILKLKKELQQVQMENDILKKVVAIFSKKQKIKQSL